MEKEREGQSLSGPRRRRSPPVLRKEWQFWSSLSLPPASSLALTLTPTFPARLPVSSPRRRVTFPRVHTCSFAQLHFASSPVGTAHLHFPNFFLSLSKDRNKDTGGGREQNLAENPERKWVWQICSVLDSCSLNLSGKRDPAPTVNKIP